MSKKGKGDYEVGYGKPPKRTQFKKGQSGNKKRKSKKDKGELLDVGAVLNESVLIKTPDGQRKVSALEAGLRSLAKRAIKDQDWRAAVQFIKICHEHGVIEPKPQPQVGGVVQIPRGVDEDEWIKENIG
jgi:hypothetical protein